MRCPNCGNENPDDYTFCDECGAKLKPEEGSPEVAQTAVAVADVPTDTAGSAPPVGTETAGPSIASAAAQAAGSVPETAVETAASSAPDEPAAPGATCPNCGAPVVPGEAFCNECGAELPASITEAAGGTATAAAQAAAPIQPYAPETGGQVPAAAGAAEEVPVTEDTAQPQAPVSAQPAPLPGVVPIEDEAAGAAAPAEFAPPEVAPGPAAEAEESHREWATQALAQLEEAQQAMASGDWAAYGQSMSGLKAFLESVAQGTAGAIAPVSTGTPMPAAAPAEYPAAPLAEAAAEPAVPAAAPGEKAAPGMARLVVISSGAELPLPQQEEITIGREDPSSGIFPDIDLTPYGGEDGGVSRRHARLLRVGGDYFVEDLQSTNYTKVDGQRLPARVREKLEDGARLDFGRVATIFRRS